MRMLHPPYAIRASLFPTFGDCAAMLLIASQVRFHRRRYDPSLPSSIDGDAGPIREDLPSGYPLLARPCAQRGARYGVRPAWLAPRLLGLMTWVVTDGLMTCSVIGVLLS
jgi:hypothetical protein